MPERRTITPEQSKEVSSKQTYSGESTPIYGHKKELIEAFNTKDQIIVVGQTGSGKTTVLPSFIYETIQKTNENAKLLVTQPRRLAARSVANYVASAYPEGHVGYRYRGESTVTPSTKIEFTVDGSLLNRIAEDPLLLDYDAVMVDEVHERSIDIDIELALLKRIQKQRKEQGKKPLKLVITSATLDKEKLTSYFDESVSFDIEGRMYDVRDHFSENEIERDEVMGEAANKAKEILSVSESGDILIFMPGKQEIDETIRFLRNFSLKNTEIIPLMGGEQDAAEQDKIYQESTKRKIIVATNVAETSITVPNIKHVIDSGLMKMNVFDKETGITRLETIDHAKSNSKQRRGRAGRVSEGDYYALFTKGQYEARSDFLDPAIQRTDLTALVLRMKQLGIDDVASFDFIDHPGEERLGLALETLRNLGALDTNEHITEIGMAMAEIPFDPHYSRMLVEAKMQGCVDAVATLVGFLSNRKPVFAYNPSRISFEEQYREFIDPESDFVTLLSLWNQYQDVVGNKEQRKVWAESKGLSRSVLYETFKVRQEVFQQHFFASDKSSERKVVLSDEIKQKVKKCIAAGFSDRILRKHGENYRLSNGKKSGIGIDRSSVFVHNKPELLVAATIREVKGGTFASGLEKVTEELLKEVAPYAFESPKNEGKKEEESLSYEMDPALQQILDELSIEGEKDAHGTHGAHGGHGAHHTSHSTGHHEKSEKSKNIFFAVINKVLSWNEAFWKAFKKLFGRH